MANNLQLKKTRYSTAQDILSDRGRFPFAEGTLWFTSDNLIVQDLGGQRNLIEGGNIHAGYLMNNEFFPSSSYILGSEYAKDKGYLYIDLMIMAVYIYGMGKTLGPRLQKLQKMQPA